MCARITILAGSGRKQEIFSDCKNHKNFPLSSYTAGTLRSRAYCTFIFLYINYALIIIKDKTSYGKLILEGGDTILREWFIGIHY